MRKLDDLTEDDLYLLGEIIFQYDDLDILKKTVMNKMNEKVNKNKYDEQSLNVRFNMDMFIKLQIFDPWEFRVIKSNHINNLQELIDCNLDELKGITPDIKEGLEWVRKAYDMEKGSRHR